MTLMNGSAVPMRGTAWWRLITSAVRSTVTADDAAAAACAGTVTRTSYLPRCAASWFCRKRVARANCWRKS